MQKVLFELAEGMSMPAFLLDSELNLIHANVQAQRITQLRDGEAFKTLFIDSGFSPALLRAGQSTGIPLPKELEPGGVMQVACMSEGYFCTITHGVHYDAFDGLDFAKSVNRHLREPLSVVFSYLPLLAQSFSAQDGVPFYLEEINRSCFRILRAVNNFNIFFEVHTVQNGSCEPVSLSGIAEDICTASATLCRDLGIPLHFEIEKGLACEIDEHLFRHAFCNLLLNAYKYTRDGNEITVLLTRSGERAHLEISDKGAGISPAHLQTIFTPHGVQNSGLGLGLASAKHIFDAAGGTLALESTLGVGTRVTAEIPLSEKAPAALASREHSELDNHFSTLRVQLCEVTPLTIA